MIALEIAGLVKAYGPTRALDGVDLRVEAGTVHCVLGENGAGKSTLCHAVGGSLTADAGTMTLYGTAYAPRRPKDAFTAGVAMVHQHFSLIPTLTVTENLRLLRLPDLRTRLSRLTVRYGLTVPLDETVGDLPLGVRQRVEIVKALLREPRLLVLDEPTGVLGPDEVTALLTTCRRIADDGGAVVLVTHKLGEVGRVADAATVLRGGRVAGAGLTDLDPDLLVPLMIGRPATELAPVLAGTLGLDERVPQGAGTLVTGLRTAPGAAAPAVSARPAVSAASAVSAVSAVSAAPAAPAVSAAPSPPSQGEAPDGHSAGEIGAAAEPPVDNPALWMRDVVVKRPGGGFLLDHVTLDVRAGEIVGVAGVEGNGQTELIRVLSGALPPDSGTVELAGRDLTTASPARRTAAGLGVVPEDRHHEGCVPALDVATNLYLGRLGEFRRWRVLLNRGAMRTAATAVIGEHGISAPGPAAPMSALSGGNQQKVVLARELALDPLVCLAAAQPTRGLDVGAVDAVLGRIREAARNGAAVLIVSSELGELLALCDRVVVAYRGTLSAPVDAASPDAHDRIAHLMSGTAA